jgi:hypothetical protein
LDAKLIEIKKYAAKYTDKMYGDIFNKLQSGELEISFFHSVFKEN